MRVTIVRTGGFAGLSREWSASVDPEEPEWHELLERLPWNESQRIRPEPDRFVYIVTCAPRSGSGGERRCRIPEQRFTGPWQELLDRVRSGDERP